MTKVEVIEAFKKGEKIRLTRGLWNNPQCDGKFAKSIEEIEEFYDWACAVDMGVKVDGIIEVMGASYCDMFEGVYETETEAQKKLEKLTK